MTKQDLQPTRHYTIGIDPDVEKNGVAIVEKETKHLECAALTFAQTLDYLQWVCSRASEVGIALNLFGCFRLPSRICDLKQQGMKITDRWKVTKTGKRVKEYLLAI